MLLRDDIAHHRKFLIAGQLIGGVAGASRALALWVAAIGYARKGVTGGIVHDAFLSKFGLDSGVTEVAKALSSRRVRLFHRVKGGYQIHDFDEHNGSTDKLRRQRELAAERKRRQRAKQPVEKSPVENSRHAVTPLVTRDNPRDSRARVKGKGKGEGVRTSTGGAYAPFFRATCTRWKYRERERRPSLSRPRLHRCGTVPTKRVSSMCQCSSTRN